MIKIGSANFHNLEDMIGEELIVMISMRMSILEERHLTIKKKREGLTMTAMEFMVLNKFLKNHIKRYIVKTVLDTDQSL